MGTVRVEGLGKAYKHYPSRWSRVAEWVLPFGGGRHELKWVLRGVSFSVERGRALGIIGVNGAGKSTLLKMITGTTQPTEGRVVLSGRVAALLELGLGFHPDFTGRQNAVMAAQLLGLAPHDIEALMPQIEAFAEIGEYMDEPVRVYSSGMQMRLAFSVATAHRPDVLIVDEALSVGDTYFQHKSFARIRQFREQGTTLLFVSHDKGSIQALCDEAILLHEGRMAMHGDPQAVADYYNALIAEKENSQVQQLADAGGRTRTVSGTGEVTLDEIALVDAQGRRAESAEVGQAVALEVTARVNEAIETLVVGIMIKDRLGQPVFGTNTWHMKRVEGPFSAGDSVAYRFAFPANFGEGSYSVAVAAHDSESHITRNYEWRDLALVFKVVNTAHPTFVGTSWVPCTVDIQVSSAQRETARQA
jgi:lipopolysaccharide transport system ATP-binding protein